MAGLPGLLPLCEARKARNFSLSGTKRILPSSVLPPAAPIGGVGASLEAEMDGGAYPQVRKNRT